jgi:hypothetical protein
MRRADRMMQIASSIDTQACIAGAFFLASHDSLNILRQVFVALWSERK